MSAAGSAWLEPLAPGTPGGVDLVLFPYAGGNPGAFRSWRGALGTARSYVASLPGRGKRFAEAPVEGFFELVDLLVDELEPVLRPRYALFGHSLGAYVAYEVARRLPVSPVALVVSGADGPQARVPAARRRTTLSDAELVDELRRLGGTPAVVLDNEELLELLMPTIRADFELVDSYEFHDGPLLDCPVHVLGGTADAHTTQEGLAAWRSLTTAPTSLREFPGGHFFVHEAEAEVQAHVDGLLRAGRRGGLLPGGRDVADVVA
ncbi:thioesterase II family protein [Motilibacter aurantiacus]|uniref:thioesterase II family protein n=1 Tax=Motilibacter aurantiacus TaxID=2714955 RepID=UPI00140A2203|nr:alpha/beta fold hydrolase [Motilibacter aurantiacus]NHC44332.1 thioesterase [Motilibacter aurantiacus]